MKYRQFCLVALASLLVLASGCSDPEDEGGDVDIAQDVGADADGDASSPDTELPDASLDADPADVDPADADPPDAAGSECAAAPVPTLGDTPLVDQWIDDASRCDQPSFSVLDDSSLGDVVDFGQEQSFGASELTALAELEGIALPREFVYDTQARVFSYLTQDRGEIIEASALLVYPDTEDPEFEPSAPLLFLHGTVGFSDACSPSTTLEAQLLASVLASMGYTVVAPDFIGLKSLGEPTGFLHPYLVGQPTAIASLDALRALYKMSDEQRGGHCHPHEYVSVGGSQGGHAALWVDRLAASYAPEFEHLGSVATVPPADLTRQAEKALQEPISATGNTIAFFGASASWYGLEDRLDELFVEPLDTSIPELFAEGCSFDEITDDYEELEDVFTEEVLDSVDAGDGLPQPWQCMLDDNGLVTTDIERHGTFLDSYATLFVLGEDDGLVDTPIERDSFVTLCDDGMPLSYLECADGPHGATTAWALPEILDFVDDRQERVEISSEDLCVVEEPVVCEGTPEEE